MGTQNAELISNDVVTQLWGYSRGVLSLTNRLCSALLVLAKKENINEIDAGRVKEAVALCSMSFDFSGTDAGKVPIAPSSSRETSMDRTTNLNKILKNLQNKSPDVEASALITEDGLIIASSLPQDLDEITVGGMSATLLNLGTRAATELRRGDVKEVIVRGEDGYGVMVAAGRGVLLLVVANENAKLGLIFFDMRTAISAIKQIL